MHIRLTGRGCSVFTCLLCQGILSSMKYDLLYCKVAIVRRNVGFPDWQFWALWEVPSISTVKNRLALVPERELF